MSGTRAGVPCAPAPISALDKTVADQVSWPQYAAEVARASLQAVRNRSWNRSPSQGRRPNAQAAPAAMPRHTGSLS